VVAGGIDVVYPPEHERLQAEIGERGCLISEQPPGFVPRAKDYPRRNRIISGISLGVVIMEAARRSGTLITARMAAEQGREVFAVPGHPLDPRAEGTNRLLKTGATLVTEPEDVLEALAPMLRPLADGLHLDGMRRPPTEDTRLPDLPEVGAGDRARLLGAPPRSISTNWRGPPACPSALSASP
jgi:DNA processing protein